MTTCHCGIRKAVYRRVGGLEIIVKDYETTAIVYRRIGGLWNSKGELIKIECITMKSYIYKASGVFLRMRGMVSEVMLLFLVLLGYNCFRLCLCCDEHMLDYDVSLAVL